jgi:hypothetical protein
MLYLATTLITLSLLPAMLVELSRYRGAAKDVRTAILSNYHKATYRSIRYPKVAQR